MGESATRTLGDRGEAVVRALSEWRLFGGAPVYVGRYRVVGHLGSGATGVVVDAFDDRLGRRVALKILRGPDDDDAERGVAMVRKEARALASISHPNVVQVFEVGSTDGAIFIAMERVDGAPLRTWLSRRPSWRAVLDVLRQAGRGLHAAHGAAIVHGDFKPSNVLVAADGRARLVDFGLARRALDDPSAAGSSEGPAGTPGYAAPEVSAGASASPLADQFSFCVTAREALVGRPLSNGAADWSPLPRRIRNALSRGLASDPRARHPSMAGLLAALETPQHRPLRTTLAVALLGVGGATIIALADRPDPRAACSADVRDRVEHFERNERPAIERAFVESGSPLAASAFAQVDAALTERIDALAQAAAEICARGDEVQGEADWRRSCLAEQMRGVDAVVRLLEGADRELVASSVDLVDALPADNRCRGTARDGQPPPPAPALAAAVDRVRVQLADAKALLSAGREEDALHTAVAASAAAAELEDAAVQIDANVVTGQLRDRLGDHQAARADLEAAYFAAAELGYASAAFFAARGLVGIYGRHFAQPDDARRWGQRAHAELARMGEIGGLRHGELLQTRASVAQARGDYEAAETLAAKSLEMVEQHEGSQKALVASLMAIADAKLRRGDLDAARSVYDDALARAKRAYGPSHPQTAMVLQNSGVALKQGGAYAEATERFERALAIFASVQGPKHPSVALPLMELSSSYALRGDHERALEFAERTWAVSRDALGESHPDTLRAQLNVALVNPDFEVALQEFERAAVAIEANLGPRHPDLLTVFGNVAYANNQLGRFADATIAATKAVRLAEDTLGKENPEVALALLTLGFAHQGAERFDEALAVSERALAIFRAAYGPDHPMTIEGMTNVGIGHALLGDHAEALPYLHQAKAAIEAAGAVPEMRVQLGVVLQCIGFSELETGDAAAALDPLERSLSLLSGDGVAPDLVARTRFTLARGLWALKRDRSRARALATQAAVDYGRVAPGWSERAEVLGWLDSTSRSRSRG